MKRLSLVGVIFLTKGHALGTAQRASLYGTFGDLTESSMRELESIVGADAERFRPRPLAEACARACLGLRFHHRRRPHAQNVGRPFNGAANANRYASG